MTVTGITVSAYTVPTDQPEADGTLTWKQTSLVVVRATDGDSEGLGWTYADPGAVAVVNEHLAPVAIGREPADVPAVAEDMVRAVRNIGRPGLAACAISAVDIALWDLKARRTGLSLTDLLGQARASVPIYGSGGFTNYDDTTTCAQLSTWVQDWGIPRVKIKIGQGWGSDAARDLARVALAREVIGPDVDLYVDANGGYNAKQAIRIGRVMAAEHQVTWLEEPVSSDDLAGLARVQADFDGDVTAGEYGYTLAYFARMLASGAVDCLQADVTRCGGYTAWLKVAALAEAQNLQISGHCAPNLHVPVAAAVANLRHVEYFHDHHRIETMLFDGTLNPDGGAMIPDRDQPGHGLRLRDDVASLYRVA